MLVESKKYNVINPKGRIVPVNLDSNIKSFKRLQGFCVVNMLPNCIHKSQGGYYAITPENKMIYFTRLLSNTTYNDLLNFLKTRNLI